MARRIARNRSPSIPVSVVALALACACGTSPIEVPVAPGPGSGEGGQRDNLGGGAGQAGSGVTSAGGAGAVLPDGEPPLFDDVPPPPLAADARRCDKVDFLYVVDNSPTMVDKQANLAQSFVGFSRIVSQTLGMNDYHMMVIDTDGISEDDGSGSSGAADWCELALGAGRRNGGGGEDCGIEGDQRYVLDEQKDVEGTFACLAKVGTFGNARELPIQAMLTATGATTGDIDDCNGGFLRDDAVLVVTLITDEDDDQTRGTPSTWKTQLLRVKGGKEESVVMLGLIADNHIPGGLRGGPCDEFSGSPSPRLESFVRSFELGAIGSVCAADYSGFFAAAVSTIDTACDQFVPVVR